MTRKVSYSFWISTEMWMRASKLLKIEAVCIYTHKPNNLNFNSILLLPCAHHNSALLATLLESVYCFITELKNFRSQQAASIPNQHHFLHVTFWGFGFVIKKLSLVITVKDQLVLSKTFIKLSEMNWKHYFAR